MKTAPPSAPFFTRIVPSWSSTTPLQIDSPTPMPIDFFLEKNGQTDDLIDRDRFGGAFIG